MPERVRLTIPELALDPEFGNRLEQALKADPHVNRVRINRVAASIAIHYQNHELSDWQLGMRNRY